LRLSFCAFRNVIRNAGYGDRRIRDLKALVATHFDVQGTLCS
jgi:hypothetical protein